jgi:hypothetical protein
MQDRPNAAEILETVARYLEDELLPALDGPLAYRTRVAANLVRILEREHARGGEALLRERELLCDLLGLDAASLAPAPLDTQVAQLNASVSAAIDAGQVAHEPAWLALMEITRAKLAIIRPGYDAWDARIELP